MHEVSERTVKEVDPDESTGKDATEQELERLLFGDNTGFYENLRAHRGAAHADDSALIYSTVEDEQNYEDWGESLEAVNDADLFFLDSGPSTDAPSLLPPSNLNDEDSPSNDNNAAAWVDSDDERITVSLANNSRLRKLRITESEDTVNGIEYIKRLRRQYERLHAVPKWAIPSTSKKGERQKRRKLNSHASDASNSDSEDEASDITDELSAQPLAKLLHNTTNIISASESGDVGRKLRPEILDVHRLKDVGKPQPSAITNLAFHPKHPLLITSGPSSTLSMHHISPPPPNPNPLLTTLHLRSTPLTTSLFLPPNGNKILFSGRRRYFHIWDLDSGHIEKISRTIGHRDEQRSMERFKLSPCGRWMGLVGSSRKGGGFINILDASTFQWVAEVRVEGKGGVADLEWWGDGEGMVVLGKGGEAVEWDGREKRVKARWIDEGAVGTTVVALGGHGAGPKDLGGDRWLAVGSSSGIVNVYDRRKWAENNGSVPDRPKPVRAFDQLTTPTSHLAFSPDGQLLCMSSRWKRDALRLVHLPSCTVYRNWPTSQTPFGRITSIGWSPKGGYLAVGNEQGKCRLWEIRS